MPKKKALNIIIISNKSEDYQATVEMLDNLSFEVRFSHFKDIGDFLSPNKTSADCLILFSDDSEKSYVNAIEKFREKYSYEPIIAVINNATSETSDLLSHFRSVEILESDKATKMLFEKVVRFAIERAALEKTISEKDKLISQLSEKNKPEKQTPKIDTEIFPSIMDAVPMMIWMSDEKMNLFYFNQRLLDFTGNKLEEDIGRGLTPLTHPDDLAKYLETYQNALKKKTNFSVEFRLRRYDGEYRWILNSGIPFYSSDGFFLGYVGACTDITEIKQVKEKLLHTEEKMRHSPKLEAIGRLAGGIAHDFNNIMGVIMLRADLLLEQMDDGNPQKRHLKEIRSSSMRAASLTQQLLAFSRKQVLQPVALNLNNVVAEMGKILKRVIGEDIEMKTILDSNLKTVMADPNQMSQVIMNLAVNSRDAMPDGGKLIITTENVTVTNEDVVLEAFQAGEYVKLTVMDTGHGVPEEIQARIFDPFFTTKGSGLGTGLGLSTAYGIVKQSGGFIFLTSEENEGASFSIYMPVHAEKEIDKPQDEETKFGETYSGTETILLVEDEDMVRVITREVLEGLGYNILEAEDGEEAMQTASRYKGTIDVLLTDVIMPKMNGKVLALKLSELRPGVKVLFMSGYNDDIVSDRGVLNEDVHYLHKPFSPSQIAKKLREVLSK